MWISRRRRGWRFYRDWLILALVWLTFGFGLGSAFKDPWHLLWMVPLAYFGTVVLKVHSLLHPKVQLAMFHLTPERVNLRYEKVEFPSRDGLTLFGWYVPGHKRAAIALVHGAGSCGIAMASHAAMLAGLGYHVLMFDLRAHGSSDGGLSSGAPDQVVGLDSLRPRLAILCGTPLHERDQATRRRHRRYFQDLPPSYPAHRHRRRARGPLDPALLRRRQRPQVCLVRPRGEALAGVLCQERGVYGQVRGVV